MDSEISLQFKDNVRLYLSGQLNQDEIDELWIEALEDGQKMNYLKTVANIKTIGDREDIDDESYQEESKVYLLRPVHYAAAAAISLLIGVLAFVSLPTSNSTIAPEKVNPIESASIDYYRSGTENSAIDGIITKAVTTYDKGNVKEATNLLNKNIENKDYSREAITDLKLQLGKIHYNEGDFEKAKSIFNEIVTTSENFNTKEKAMWLLANSYLQSSRSESENALDVLKKISMMKGAHSRMAESMLNKIE